MKNLFIYIFILSSTSLYRQEDGSETFNPLSDAIKPSILSGYILNSGLTWDNSFLLKITFNQNESEENQNIYNGKILFL